MIQKGQMDIVVYFWNESCHKVCYLISVFLQAAATTEELLKFQKAMSSLSLAKLLQIFMDGAAVDQLFL